MSISIHRMPLIKVLFALAIVGVGAISFLASQHFMTKTSSTVASTTQTQSSAQQAATVPAVGTTASIDALTNEDASGEAAINAKYEQADQSSSQATNEAAANIGGAYNESTY